MDTNQARTLLLLSGLVLPVASCDRARDDDSVLGPGDPSPAFSVVGGPPAPSPLVDVAFGGRTLELWPFTGVDFETATDPINLIFLGNVDPRALRAALMGLNGNRTAFGFPATAPFDCVWKDAVGGMQTAFADDEWAGSAVQLECGDYDALRFHIRLFGDEDWTLGNAHLDVLIPGTTDHEVISWELPQQLVLVDMLRTGLLDATTPLGATGVINPAPSYRTINPLVYNGLPDALIALIGGPPKPAAAPVPLPNDGSATIFNVAGEAAIVPGRIVNEFVIQFGQLIPKPFCSTGPLDFVFVTGPVSFRHTVDVTPSGAYRMHAHAAGRLSVTPVDPTTSPPSPIGDTHDAEVLERYTGELNGQISSISSLQQRTLLPVGDPFGGRQKTTLHLGPGGSSGFESTVRCGAP